MQEIQLSPEKMHHAFASDSVILHHSFWILKQECQGHDSLILENFEVFVSVSCCLPKRGFEGTVRGSQSLLHTVLHHGWTQLAPCCFTKTTNTFAAPRAVKTEHHSCDQLRGQLLQKTLLWTFPRLSHSKHWRTQLFPKSSRPGERNAGSLCAVHKSRSQDYLSLNKIPIKVNCSCMF